MTRHNALGVGVSILWTLSALGQAVLPPRIQWQRTYGGDSIERHPHLQRTADGGFFLTGSSASGISGTKGTTNVGDEDFWVLRLDSRGSKVWEATFGSESDDGVWDARETSDGGCVVVGETISNTGGYDFWVVRVDANGNKLWDKIFGGDSIDSARGVSPTTNGGFLVAGGSASGIRGNKTTPNLGDYDLWIVCLDPQGGKLWERVYGGPGDDFATDAHQTPDGGFMLVGYSSSSEGPLKESPNYGAYDVWLVRIDPNGNKLWDKSFGGPDDDRGRRLLPTADGGFLLGASTMSWPGGNKESPFYGGLIEWGDYWILRLDTNGNKIWERDFGTSGMDAFADIAQSIDGGFYVAGSAGSTNVQIWLVRLNANGTEIWNHRYDGSNYLFWPSIQNTLDGGILMAAERWGDSGDTRSTDLMLFKLSPDALTAPQLTFPSLVSSGADFRFGLSGISGRTYVTEWSSDLRTWSPVATNRLMSDATEIVDAATGDKRFYRARMLE